MSTIYVYFSMTALIQLTILAIILKWLGYSCPILGYWETGYVMATLRYDWLCLGEVIFTIPHWPENFTTVTQEDPSQSTPYTEHTVSFVQWAEINEHLVVCYLLYQTCSPPVLFNNPCSFTNINASFIFELYLRERLLQKKPTD